ncbi:uncharacterized protein DS421_5g164120 [Arachis hypogaea]|nr:uncharacterized protein DS421_5g164120 [Arachis hypogaea]
MKSSPKEYFHLWQALEFPRHVPQLFVLPLCKELVFRWVRELEGQFTSRGHRVEIMLFSFLGFPSLLPTCSAFSQSLHPFLQLSLLVNPQSGSYKLLPRVQYDHNNYRRFEKCQCRALHRMIYLLSYPIL